MAELTTSGISTELVGRRVRLRPLARGGLRGLARGAHALSGLAAALGATAGRGTVPDGGPDHLRHPLLDARARAAARHRLRLRDLRHGALRRRGEHLLGRAGPVPERLCRLLDRPGPGRPGLRARGLRARCSASPSRRSACTGCRSRSSPATARAAASPRSSGCAARASPSGTSRSTAGGRTTSATPLTAEEWVERRDRYFRQWLSGRELVAPKAARGAAAATAPA